MKRALYLVMGIFLLVGGLAPYVFGLRAEQTFTALVQLVAADWDVPLYTTRYIRGWFCSTADTFLILPPDVAALVHSYLPHLPTASPGLAMTHHIRHGPLPFGTRPDGTLSLLPAQATVTSALPPRAIEASPAGPSAEALPALQIYTTVLMHGVSQGYVVIPAFASPPGAPTEARLVWEGLHGEVTIGAYGEHMTGSVRAPGLQWTGADRALALHDVAIRTEISTGHRQPSRSDTSVQLAALELRRPQAAHAAWAITGGAVHATTTSAAALLHAAADVRLDTLRLGETPYGPGTSHLALRRLHSPTFGTLLREVSAQWQDDEDMAGLWARLRRSGELARLWSALASTQPEIALTRLQLHTPTGEIHASGHLRLDGNHLRAPEHLVQLLQTVEAYAEGQAPVAWVREQVAAQVSKAMRARSTLAAMLPGTVLDRLASTISDQQLRSLVAQGYLVLDGTMYRSQARYRHGQLLVNDKLLPWPGLVQ